MSGGLFRRAGLAAGTVAVCALLYAVAYAVPAAASEPGCSGCNVWWGLTADSLPTNLTPGGEGKLLVLAENLGDAKVSSPFVVTDKLPAGITAQSVSVGIGVSVAAFEFLGALLCNVQPSEVTCRVSESILALLRGSEFSPEHAYGHLEMVIKVKVEESAKTGELTQMSVSGGGAPAVSLQRPISVSGEPARFGLEQYRLLPENADGSIDTQAGSHPFQLTSDLALHLDGEEPADAAKDLHFDLPPGLIGNPTVFPQCPIAKFTVRGALGQNTCPDNTAIGMASVTYKFLEEGSALATSDVPLFSLVPSIGEPARFGFDVLGVPVYLDTSVRTGSDYGVKVTVPNITELSGFYSDRVTFWGVPGDPRHDSSRGWNCVQPIEGSPPCTSPGETSPPPLLTLPTSCEGPFRTSVEGDSWQNEGVFTPPLEYTLEDDLGRQLGMDGCNQLPFGPSIGVAPDGQAASTPTGLNIKIHVAQESGLDSNGLGEGDVRDTTVALPEGVTLNPSEADGLQTCSEQQIGYLPEQSVPGKLRFTPGFPSCPEASKVATVVIRTPLLPNPLKGAVYLAAQDKNPFGSLFALYLVAEDPVSGTLVKLPGKVVANETTGQLVSTFEDTPQLPFEELELHFFGGERAPLSTPPHCGTYTTQASFTPWSSPIPVASSSSFEITSGPNGAPCPGATLPFAPSLTAGTTSVQAGGFTPFTMTVSREDGQQNIGQIKLHLPPGLSGLLTGVELCPEARANAGTCGPNSLIGETTVSVGLGGDPYSVTGGKVYITEKYRGAPFGISVVVPAKAGPFDLGTVVVRGRVQVDPIDSSLTVTTNSQQEGNAIPHILDGIPLQIKHVNFTTTRAGFTFNPTNCDRMAVSGSIASVEGASSPVAEPFQVTNCAILGFAPRFSAYTSAKTSRADGASLRVRLAYPKESLGKYANVKSVKVDLPKQLPSRLPTLQQACTAATFAANPAGCPAASKVGTARASTPLIPVPLEGPAYFVSHGGAAFPELVIVLQGYGITVDLHGETFINEKTNITSSTFRTIPDVPVGTFELNLPEGRYSALAANADLCTSKLAMPTVFTAQNGAQIKQSTPIAVSGCKAAIRVVGHGVKGSRASVRVAVPSAGTLVLAGADVNRSVMRVARAGTVTIGVTLAGRGRRVLAKNPHQRVDAKVKLSFAPKHGAALTASVRLLIG